MRDTERADRLLVVRGLARSRTLAQRLIEGGHVHTVQGGVRRPVRQASECLPEDARLEVAANPLSEFVSRGGRKLSHALDHSGIDVTGFTCLDVGQSTGGFTDCLLQRGAQHVVGIDVGHGQLHPRLAADPRVVALTGINARALPEDTAPGPFDLIVADVSFISIGLLIDHWMPRLGRHGQLLALVKPQFELGRKALGKGGIVRDPALYVELERSMRGRACSAGLAVIDYFPSAITGGDGNREFFLHARPHAYPTS